MAVVNGSRETDVLIVGSGAVGSSLAARLAAAGHAVLVLEAGPARSNQDLVSSAIWARRLKWGGSTVIETGDKPVGHTFNAGYGTGGSALHQQAASLRPQPKAPPQRVQVFCSAIRAGPPLPA